MGVFAFDFDTCVLTHLCIISLYRAGNLAMTFDFGAPSWAAPLIDVPPVNDTWDSHEKPRRDPRAQAQMAEFFKTGR